MAENQDTSNKRLQQAQAQVGEVVDIMRVNVEKVGYHTIRVVLDGEFILKPDADTGKPSHGKTGSQSG